MKKIVLMLTLAVLASMVRAELVDDFDSYEAGLVRDVASPPWTAIANTGLAMIIDDGTGNKVISAGWNSGWRGAYNDNITPVADGTDNMMLYYSVYANSESLNHVFGMSDVEGASLDWFDDYEVQIGLTDNGTAGDGKLNLNVRNAGGNITTEIDLQTWYNVWVLIDQINDTYDVYISTSDIYSATLVADNAQFRNAQAGAVGDLTALLVCGYNASGQQDMWIDNVKLEVVPWPYDSIVDQTANGAAVDVTLKWNPARDPEKVEEVNPDIVEEYVFVGAEGEAQYYVGSLGDPGITLTESVFELSLDYDTTYNWTVVDALDGYAQTLTTANTLDDADPNNIIGRTWTFDTLLSSAVITTQPSDARAFETDDSVSFTVGFNTVVNPVVAADWYKDGEKLTVGGDVSVTFTSEVGDGESTLTIATPTADDEGQYYCVLNTDSNTSVTSDDSQSATRLLTIKRLLAKYTFDNESDPLADTGEFADEVGVVREAAELKTVSLDDPNEVLAVSATPVVVDGIVGTALYLDGDEYVDLDSESYPKAGPLNTLGDIRGSGYEKQGFGRGMDAGSILLWIKPESDGCVIGNASNLDGTHIAVTTNGTDSARVIVRGENWDGGWQNLGEANGAYNYMTDYSMQDGEWHLFAATWDESTARIYINGELVSENTQGYAENYTAWDFSNLIGVSRQGQPNRHLLNAGDFVTGAIDEVRIYNYPISAADIASEYELLNEVGVTPCLNHNFVGSEVNLDNTASSYCVVDLVDFALLAGNWLANGF